MEDYEKKYTKALERAKEELGSGSINKGSIEYIFPELAESEDERIRKRIYNYINVTLDDNESVEKEKWLAWIEKHVSPDMIADAYLRGCNDTEEKLLERQSEHDNFRNKIQVGDEVTRNEDGVLVNMSQLNRIAKHDDVKPKFHEGDIIKPKNGHCAYCQIIQVDMHDKKYRFDDGYVIDFSQEDAFELVKRKPVDKVEPKFKIGDTMRTLREANEGYTSGMPVIVSIDDEYYHCTNELIAIKDQYEYEYPPMNRKPKFKVDDFVVIYGFVLKILNVRNDLYETEFIQTGEFRVYDTYVIDKGAHLWTIQDVKIGDILATYDSIFMFKDIYMANKPEAYCGLKAYCGLMTGDGEFFDNACPGCWTNRQCWPASKQQRELLFKKMKEHGVTFNDKTKELTVRKRAKFNVGDWLQYRNAKPFLVKEITEQGYVNDNDCLPFSWENEIHRWTFADAKNGDILDFGFGNGVGIFKWNYDNYYALCHCHDSYGVLEVNTCIPYDARSTRPATPEQCETLRLHIFENGYMWDDETKKLKKRNMPKFKKDDYIVDAQGNIHQIERVVENVTDNTYGYDIVGGGYFNEASNIHRWTLADAKDGDVLADAADDDTCIFVFKNINNDTNAIKTYCTFFTDGNVFDNGCILYANIDNTKPATKEQRTILFKHILDNGYVWDDESKELKQNDIDKPLFKVGDWIASDYGNAYVSAVNDTKYTLLFEDGLSDDLSIKNININWHPWTIDDAKPGDMLASDELYPADTDVPNSFVAIYKGINHTSENRFDSYCFVSYSGKFSFGCWHTSTNIHPATKEQRELLSSKMNEAGYEWDVENMQLREMCNDEDE